MFDTLDGLILATVLFLAIHIVPSSFLRAKLVGMVGENGYLAGYSILSAVFLAWMIMAYINAPVDYFLWDLGNVGRYLAIPLMALAFILFIGPFTGASPTSVKAQSTIEKEGAHQGLNAITRHPMMWSFVIWAFVHALNNGDLKSLVFFVGYGGLALAGTFLIDAKRAKELGPKWAEYKSQTSNIPFAAILAGRAQLSIKQLWWRVAIGLFLFMAAYHTHELVLGVSPFPFRG